jgi:phage shock protein A
MLNKLANAAAVSAAFLCVSSASAQEPAQQREAQPSLEDRVTALEHQLASLETRFEARTTPGVGGAGEPSRYSSISIRVDQLERSLNRLTNDVQRAQRQADDALRAASQAQRDATAAEQLARQAANRIR